MIEYCRYSIVIPGQGFFSAKKNANPKRNRIGVFFSAPKLLF